MASMVGKERDEDLALFHEVKAAERIHFLHPNEEDFEASLRYRILATAPAPQHKSPNDLLGLEPEKNDYDWLLTPPGTPLFPSLDHDAPGEAQLAAAAIRASSRSRQPSRISRGSASPRRPSSPSPSSSSAPSLTRRASFGGSSSPSRPSSRSVTPTSARPSTPGRSSTTPTRRALTPSATFHQRSATSNNVGGGSSSSTRNARSSSPARRPRVAVHPAMPHGFASEPPPNLRTTMPDRGAGLSKSRGSSLSPRLGGSASTKSSSDRRAVSPSLSRSFSSSASSSKGSLVSSQNSGVEISRPSRVANLESAPKRPISGQDETSPVKPVTKKAVRMSGAGSFSAVNSQRKSSFDGGAARQMDFRRNTTSGFRPLMSNSHISSFYTRASSSLQQRSVTTDSSINSSAASALEDEHEDQAESKPCEDRDHDHDEFLSMDAMVDDREDGGLLDASQRVLVEELRALDGMEEPPSQSEMAIDCAELAAATPTSIDYSPRFQVEDMEIDESGMNEDEVKEVRSVLEFVIDKAVDLVENERHRVAQSSKDLEVTKVEERISEALAPSSSTIDGSVHCLSQLIDPRYSSSSIEVYQFDQELHSKGSEVGPTTPPPKTREYSISPTTSTTTISEKKSSTTSSTASQQSNTPTAVLPRADHPKSINSSTSADHSKFTNAATSADNSAMTRPSSRTMKTTTLRDPPSLTGGFFGNSKHYRKRDSRESSLFSIQISSSKGGESISSGRLASTDDTQSSVDTPRRVHHLDLPCNGDVSSNGTFPYKASDEYDTKSEESCVDYYIDSMEPPRNFLDMSERMQGSKALSSINYEARNFDNDEDTYVDYYIDDFSLQQKPAAVELMEPRKKMSAPAISDQRQEAMDIVMEEERALLVDDTHIEVCSMEESSSESGERDRAERRRREDAQGDEEIDRMTECWKQLEEAEMECNQQREQAMKTLNPLRSSPSSQQPIESSSNATGSSDRAVTTGMISINETRDSILFCSSIVHDIVYRAASLGIEKEDLKSASADELVTFLGLSKTHNIPNKFVETAKWKSTEESTLRRTLAYMQNQKVMEKTTVAFMENPPLANVEEDVKEIPEHHFIDPSIEAVVQEHSKRSKAKCHCTIL